MKDECEKIIRFELGHLFEGREMDRIIKKIFDIAEAGEGFDSPVPFMNGIGTCISVIKNICGPKEQKIEGEIH